MTVDAVLSEILRHAFISVAEEMNRTLIRTAYSPAIYEMQDSSVGVFDKQGRLLGQSTGLPIFLGNLEEAIHVVVRHVGADKLRAGDVFILNDSYLLGTHLADMSVVAPVFQEKTLLGFSVSRAHWRDVGAKDPGSPVGSTSIYQEGLRLGPTRIVKAGVLDEELLDILRRNSRTPDLITGDLQAQLAAANVGERGLLALAERYGLETLEQAAARVFAQTEALDREAVAALPDGHYRAEGFLDNDDVGTKPVKVCVAITIKGGEMVVDLSGSETQTRGSINCGYAQTISGCRVAFKMLVNPHTPVNGGSFRPLQVKVPEGTIFHAQEPAACQYYFTPLGLLIDLIIKALAPAMPEKAAAAHFGDSMVVDFIGTGSNFFIMAEALAGGWGASQQQDGENGLINNVNGGLKNMPIEVVEAKFPIRIKQFGKRASSGGAGRYQGGLGVVREYEVLDDDIFLTLHLDRSHTPAWGLFGGGSAKGPSAALSKGEGWQQLPLKTCMYPVAKGTRVKIETGGGGGYGTPEK